jgi:hypothetical protein
MSREMKIGVGLVILIGLGVGVYYQQKKDAAKGTTEIAQDLPDFKGTDDVDKIDITTTKEGKVTNVVLEKKGDKWELTKPVSALANQANVKSLLDNMKEVKLTETIARKPDDATKANYELDADHSLHLVTFKGGDKKLDAVFGKSGGRGNMVMVTGKEDIYAASGYSGWMYSRTPSDFRDKEMFKFDEANVTGVIISNKNGTFDFSKSDKWTAKFKPEKKEQKAIEKFDEAKLTAAIGQWKNLNAEDFGDGKPVSDTGLDAPEATVTIALKDGTHTLRVGKVANGSSHYALRDSDPTIFVIGMGVDWATAEVSKFQKPLDGGVEKPEGPPDGMGMPPGMMGMPPGMQMPPGMGRPPGHP